MAELIGGIAELLIELIAYGVVNAKDNSDIKKINEFTHDGKIHKRKDAILLLMMVTHIYFHDDNNLSRKEHRYIKQEIKKRKSLFTYEEHRIIKHIYKKVWTLDDIKCYIYIQGIEEYELYKIINDLDINDQQTVYAPVITKLKMKLI